MQAEAVKATEGPVLVLAGAGSGKTKTLTHRLAFLLKEKGVSPLQILAVTFTNKAAGEMRQRIARLLDGDRGLNIEDRKQNGHQLSSIVHLPWLGTFHSVGVKILRRDGENIGLDPNFTIYDSDDQLALIRSVCRDLALSPKQYSPQAIRSHISSAKNELINAAEYAKYAHGYFQSIVTDVFKKYEKALTAAQAVDFDDLIGLPVKLFHDCPEVLARYHELWRYIMIDEYQDTNKAQYEFVRLLAQKYRNIFVVGDDAQSIYSFRGANFRNILDFEKDYPDAKVIKLEQNYRSTQVILDASNHLIRHNQQRTDKNLWTEKGSGEPITIYTAGDGRDEGEFIMTQLLTLQRTGHRLKDCAILYRTNAQSRALEEMCLNYSVPYKLIGAVRFYERKEIKDILAYLRFVTNPKDSISFERLLGVPPRGLGTKSIEVLKKAVISDELSEINQTVTDSPIRELKSDALISLSPRIAKVWLPLGNQLESWRNAAKNLSVADIIDKIVKESGYERFLLDGTEEGEARFENVKELKSVASLTNDLSTFLAEVALVSDIDGYDATEDAITMMTLHAAKGLEFPVVFMVGLEEGLFPNMRSAMDPTELEEERRLCYVGMTRAQDRLYMIHAQTRLLYGQLQANLPSRFIREVPEELVDKV